MKRILVWALPLLFALSFASCTDEDSWAEMTLSNRYWRVVEASYGAPYERGDLFYFYRDGGFEVEGYRLHEYGRWRVRGGRLLMHFDGSPHDVDIEAPIPVLDEDYVALDCRDYAYNMSYSLRMVAVGYLDGYGYDRWYTRPK
ncbi:MAG: hypothetical protein IJ729_04305 [Alloprevotella sp.]|nr:hypothetical protein [Alloprevotella sp.]